MTTGPDDNFEIETDRLSLQVLDRTDLGFLHRLQSDPDVMRHIGNGPRTRREVEAMMDKLVEHRERHGFGIGKVVEKASGVPIGQAGVIRYQLDHDHRDVEILYGFFKESWGLGYGTEIAAACLAWAFDNLAVPRVTALVYADNFGSQRILKRLGMSVCADLEAYGRYGAVFEITREDFRSRQGRHP